MKYFAKYIPVEGEIKVGDKVICNGAVDTVIEYPFTDPQTDGDGGYDIVLEREGTQCGGILGKPVKLFLCSRDIQVGNTVTDGGIYHMWKVLEISDNGKQLTLDCSKERWFPPDGLFSVIGEISPDAVFVKEGDEFTDDQIDMRIKNGTYITEVDNLKHIPSEEVKNWSPLALIKCPCCGRFS